MLWCRREARGGGAEGAGRGVAWWVVVVVDDGGGERVTVVRMAAARRGRWGGDDRGERELLGDKRESYPESSFVSPLWVGVLDSVFRVIILALLGSLTSALGVGEWDCLYRRGVVGCWGASWSC